MGTLRRTGFTVIVAIFTLLATSAVFADNDNDPPSRAARLDYISGEVSIQPGGVNDWVAATLNRPMTTSDRIWTDKDSRAEVQVGSGTFRIDSETSVTLSNVSDNTVQIELDQGTLYLHVRNLFPGEIYEIDTPNTAFTVTKGGDYRLNVNSNNDVSLVTVWHGEGMATGDGPAVKIRSGEQGSFSGGRSMAHTVYPAPGRTGFDDWCAVRDRRQDSSASARYVAPGVVGYEDLDEYGAWRTYPGYGPVWVPAAVAPGWAPYRFGHWVWVAPWGWTWVDDAPWGYAPFHYGRWAYVGGVWGWCPGPVYVRPVYAPALVAWVGGAHWGVSIGVGGGVGWFPLGYGEPYVPWYHAGPGYWRNVNVSNTRITNVTVINNYYNNRESINNIHYANRSFPNAVTAVPQRAFVNSQPVGRNMVAVSNENLRNARVMGGSPFEPSRQSVLGANAGRPAAVPPQQAFNRQPVRNMTPPPAPASPFNNGRNNANNAPMGRPNGNMGGPRPGRVAEAGPTRPGNSVPHPPTVFNGNNNVGPNAGRPNAGEAAAPHPPTVFGNSNATPGNAGNVNRAPNATNDAGRMPANNNSDVARPYPHPPSAGERQPMGNPGYQPARTYTPQPQNQGGQNPGGQPHTYSVPPSNQPQRSYGPPANQQPDRSYTPPPQNQGGQPHTYSAPPSNQPQRNYGPPANQQPNQQPPRTYSAPEGRGQQPAGQPQHSTPRPPSNDKNDKPQHERNTASTYGGSSSGYMASNYNYPRPMPGSVRSTPATNYSAGSSYSGASGRSYPSPSAGYSPRAYSAPSRSENYGYSASRMPSYSAPSRSYSAPSYNGGGRSYSAYNGGGRSYSGNSGGRSYSAPSYHSAPSGGGRSGGGSVARSSGGGHSGGGSTHGH